MKLKRIWQTVQVNGISSFNDYNSFMYCLNNTREKIKELYPEVEDKDIEIDILTGDYDGNIEFTFEFKRFETVEEQNKRLSNEERQREIEKEKMMKEIQSFFKLYPELKESVLNS
jgi:predicted N-acyltransferase